MCVSIRAVRTWLYDPANDERPPLAEPGDVEGRRAVLLAAACDAAPAEAWMAVDNYDGDEATLLFGAPPGDKYRSYVSALVGVAVEEAQRLGFRSLLAHWRGGWSSATDALKEAGFAEDAPGIWRLPLCLPLSAASATPPPQPAECPVPCSAALSVNPCSERA